MNAIKDKTPILILIFAALVGIASGLASICFKKVEDWVALERITIASYFHEIWLTALISGLISTILGGIAYFLVCRYSPEAGGSGIPEIEGALENVREVRWWRVIPVKFLGGICSLGSGMLLGREGPTVQLCANIAKMLLDIFRIKDKESQHVLLATGAAAGLSAAFNAPLAGVLFIIEEMRPQFRYSLISIKAIMVGVILSTIVFRVFNGQDGVISMQTFSHIPLETLWLYLLLGIIFGVLGVWFNYTILFAQKKFEQYHQGKWQRFIRIGFVLGGICGVANIIFPQISGGGFELISSISNHNYAFSFILCVFVIRVLLTILCFSSGAPGGIFAPMLALGTLFGTLFGLATSHLFPHLSVIPTTYAIAGMGALFAASVGAPLTGIILVLEMTSNYQLILPMIITCLGATMSAQVLGGRPLYSTILERTLKKARLKNNDMPPSQPAQQKTDLTHLEQQDDLPICESCPPPATDPIAPSPNSKRVLEPDTNNNK